MLRPAVVFLEDYDMAVARYLVQGVDVWLNTPLRPMEASGTSGMKAAANGVLNLSMLDGWWDEAWNDPRNRGDRLGHRQGRDVRRPGLPGPGGGRGALRPAGARRGSDLLRPRRDRIPRRWVERMKADVNSLCHFVNTHRMVRDFVEGYYVKAHAQFRALERTTRRGPASLPPR